MKKSLPLLAFGLLSVGLLYLYAMTVRTKIPEKQEHLKVTVRRQKFVLPMLESFSRHRQLLSTLTDATNSWRLECVSVTPWMFAEDKDMPPNAGVPWQSEFWDDWDNHFHKTFCLQKLQHLPRERRYTRLMTIQGKGSAIEFIRAHGIEELRRVAPQTIFLVEVINSSTPWLQAGDLELSKMPRSINHSNRLGIGSAFGFDQFVVGFVDGSIWIVDSSIPFSELEKFITVEQAKGHNREAILGEYGTEVEEAVGID